MTSIKYVVIMSVFVLAISYISCEQESQKSELTDSYENELENQIAYLLETELENENNKNSHAAEVSRWQYAMLKRALPRMGKRFNAEDNSDESDEASSDEQYEKRALPRMGRAMPRMGRAMPRMGRAMPRMGRAIPRMGRALPRMGRTLPRMG